VLVPLVSDNALLGAILLGAKQSGDMFTLEDAAFLELLAPEASIAMVNAKLYVDLEHTFLGTIAALAAAVDAKGGTSGEQVHEVTEYCMAVATQLGLDDAERETLRTAATLHDIGKISVDSAILDKPGRLTPEEIEAVRAHPDIAANILEPLGFLADVIPIVRHHHERWDGNGYPAGLSGEAIPLGARIIAVADAYHTMTSAAPERGGMGHDDAVVNLYAGSGTLFDPEVVEAMLAVLSRWHGHPSTWPDAGEQAG
jgi:putative nucleotidyltransferase with HDIG domain